MAGRGHRQRRIQSGAEGVAHVGRGEFDAPDVGLETDPGGDFPFGHVGDLGSGNARATGSIAVNVFAASGDERLIERRARPGRAEEDRHAHVVALEGIVTDERLDPVHVGGAGVGDRNTDETEAGARADDLLEVGDETGELRIEVAAAVTHPEFIADAFLGLHLVRHRVLRTRDGDALVDAAEERIGVVDFVVQADPGDPPVEFAVAHASDGVGRVRREIGELQIDGLIADAGGYGEAAYFEVVLDPERGGGGLFITVSTRAGTPIDHGGEQTSAREDHIGVFLEEADAILVLADAKVQGVADLTGLEAVVARELGSIALIGTGVVAVAEIAGSEALQGEEIDEIAGRSEGGVEGVAVHVADLEPVAFELVVIPGEPQIEIVGRGE